MKLVLLCLMIMCSLAGCISHSSLYDELGGKDGIDRISARFISGIGQDEEIRPYFEQTNLDRFYRLFSLHLCQVVEGPCQYTGDEMVPTHVGMGITEKHFNRTVDLLIDAMESEGIPHPVQNRVLAKLAPLRDEVIYQ